MTENNQQAKADAGKPQLTLVPRRIIWAIAKVREYGCKKYPEGGNLRTDWMQKIYQYYLADRKEKKQDYTPSSLAQFMGLLAGNSESVTDMCAGSGALIIQKWNQNCNTEFIAIEIDENVIPFLLFNMVLRNIRCDVFLMDALTDEEPKKKWTITRGEKYGCIV